MNPETIAISKFKATCLELLKKVKQTGRPLLVTRKGEPVALITAPPLRIKADSWLGSFRDSGEIKGDVVAPLQWPGYTA